MYRKSAKELEAESGFQLESPAVTRFRDSVLQGDWNAVELLIGDLNLDTAHELSVIDRSFIDRIAFEKRTKITKCADGVAYAAYFLRKEKMDDILYACLLIFIFLPLTFYLS